MPENAPLYPEMLVQEYLAMIAELRGVAPEQVEAAVARAAVAVGVGEHLIRPIGELSKGYRQRVGIAQAILHSPDVLVLALGANEYLTKPIQANKVLSLARTLLKED